LDNVALSLIEQFVCCIGQAHCIISHSQVKGAMPLCLCCVTVNNSEHFITAQCDVSSWSNCRLHCTAWMRRRI